jgi:hypothetical protein
VVDETTRAALEQLAKELYYPERSWPALLARALEVGLPRERIQRLREWLPQGRVDQKRADALAMLRSMREYLAKHPGPQQVSYTLAHTEAWAEACRCSARLGHDGSEGEEPLPREALLEELQVGGLLPRMRSGALARALALEEAQRSGDDVSLEEIQQVCEAFRREHGLNELPQFKQWLMEERISQPLSFFRDEARLHRITRSRAMEAEQCLPDHLRSLGIYGALLERARRKAQRLGSSGLEPHLLEEPGLDEEALWRWYFTERLGRPLPSSLERYALGMGLANVEELRRKVLRERCFLILEAAFLPEEQGA